MGWFRETLFTEKNFIAEFARLTQHYLRHRSASGDEERRWSLVLVDTHDDGSVQLSLELSRCFIGLYLCDLPHKLGHNIMTQAATHELLQLNDTSMPQPRRPTIEHFELLAGDNDRAHWTNHKMQHYTLSPTDVLHTGIVAHACNR
jgi:hypothetical protein